MSRRHAKPLTTEGVKTFDRVCEAPGCRLHGEFRAPFARDKLDQYRWFCLEHVRDYNKKWDYFAGLDADAIEQHIRADTIWRRPVWPLPADQDGARSADEPSSGAAAADRRLEGPGPTSQPERAARDSP